jgi:hypothetical protein
MQASRLGAKTGAYGAGIGPFWRDERTCMTPEPASRPRGELARVVYWLPLRKSCQRCSLPSGKMTPKGSFSCRTVFLAIGVRY